MAFARDVYTATGGQTDFTISFPYLESDHLVVTQNGVETSAYTLPNATTVRLDSGATADDTIVISRSTSQSTRLTDYTAGVLTEADLDNDSLQAFYMAQEAIDQVALGLKKDSSEIWDALSIRIQNVATPSVSTDAVTKAYVDAISAAAGNVPTPGNPGEDDYILKAGSGTFAWTSPADIRTALALGALAVLATVDTAQIDDDAITTAKILNDAVSLAKIASGTAGDILYWDGSGNPTALAAGTQDYVLTMGATVPAWAENSPGAWELVSNTAVGSGTVTEVTVTDIASGYDYRITISGVQPTQDNDGLRLQTSSDNGSTYDSGASDYAFGLHYVGSITSNASSSSDSTSYIDLTSGIAGIGFNAEEHGTCEIVLINPGSTTLHTVVNFDVVGMGATQSGARWWGVGTRKATAAVDAVRFYWDTGNFEPSVGRIIVERRART